MKRILVAILLLVLVMIVIGGVGVAAAAPPLQEAQDYTVQKDDNLWNLADKYFGNGAAYPAIVIATNAAHLGDASYAKIINPNLIYPGQKFRIPSAEDATAYLTRPQPGELGSAERPVKLYFVPSVDAAVIVESGEAIARYIKGLTGIHIEVSVPTSYAATIEAMGVAEGDAMGFIPALGYVLANQKYGVEVTLAVVRFGRHWYASQFLVRADSGITSLEQLAGKKWAVPSLTSTSGFLYPTSLLISKGIEPGEQVVAGGHPQAVLAVYEGSADFATTYYSPPGGEGDWKWGDPPEPAGEYHIENGKPYIGDLRIRDARSAVVDTAPDVIEKVKILALSDQIPNDTVSFVKDFPPILKHKIVNALLAYAGTEEGKAVLENDKFYDISGFARVDDAFYDPVRSLIKNLGYTEEDILK